MIYVCVQLKGKTPNNIILQPLSRNGENGVHGLNAPRLVGWAPKLGLEHAVIQLLRALSSVPEMQQRLKTVHLLTVEVSQVSLYQL